MLQPPRRPPPPPTCPGPLRSSPRPALPVTESSRHGVCLRACELPKLIVMVLSRAQRPGCFLASAVGLHKRQGRRKWVLLGSSGSDERQLLFVGEQLTASPPAACLQPCSRLLFVSWPPSLLCPQGTPRTSPPTNSRGLGGGGWWLLPGASSGFLPKSWSVWRRGFQPGLEREKSSWR